MQMNGQIPNAAFSTLECENRRTETEVVASAYRGVETGSSVSPIRLTHRPTPTTTLILPTSVDHLIWLPGCTREWRSRNRPPGGEVMSTSSAVRSRKEIPNSLAGLPGCRAVVFLLALPLFAHAWQTTTPPVAACQAAGQVAGWDIVGHMLSVKSDSGDYSDFQYDRSTT